MVHPPLLRKNDPFKITKIIFVSVFSEMAHYCYTGIKTCSSCFSAFKQSFFSSVLVLYDVTGLWIASYHIRSVFQLSPNNTVNRSESSISRDTPAENDEESVLRCVGVQ